MSTRPGIRDSAVVTKNIIWRDNTRIKFTFDALPDTLPKTIAVLEDTASFEFKQFIHHPEAQPVIASTFLMTALFLVVLFRGGNP